MPVFILLSPGCLGLAQRYQENMVSRINAEYERHGIQSYTNVPIIPVAFLMDRDGEKMDIQRGPYLSMEYLSRHQSDPNVIDYVVARSGSPLAFSEAKFWDAYRAQCQNTKTELYRFSEWYVDREARIWVAELVGD